MRAEEVAAEVPHSYTTARTLLSILRLSQALARLRFADSVDQVRAEGRVASHLTLRIIAAHWLHGSGCLADLHLLLLQQV